MLGLKWEKQKDTLAVVTPHEDAQPNKRGILGKLAKTYDHLGLISTTRPLTANVSDPHSQTNIQRNVRVQSILGYLT